MMNIPYEDKNMEGVRQVALKCFQKLISDFRDDLRYLRHLGLPDKTYDAYIELDNKWERIQNET